MRQRIHIGLCFLLMGLVSMASSEGVLVIQADRIETVTAGVIENGVIVIEDGKIREIGSEVEIPDGAEILDVQDKVVCPGFVNPFSRLGLSAGPAGGVSSHPHYRVVDELVPFQDVYERILQAGFTTLGLGPAGNGITGQGTVIRPVNGLLEQMVLQEPGFLAVSFAANDRAKKVLKDALESAKKQKNSTDPKIEPLAQVLDGKLPLIVHCNWPAEALHLLKLLKPYEKLRLVLVMRNQTYRIADKLVEKKIPLLAPAQIDFEQFTRDRINIPRELAEAGVKLACQPPTDSTTGHGDFRRRMAELVRSGLDREIALKSMTIHPAEMLGLDYRLGSLEPGKDANLLILSGNPLDTGTRIEQVMIEGKTLYQNASGDTHE